MRESKPHAPGTRAPARWGAVVALGLAAGAFAFSLAMVGHELGFASPWFGLLLMLCLLGLFGLARPLFLPRMPAPLQAIRPWECGPQAYRGFGVRAFGALLKRPPLRHLNPDVHLRRQHGDARAVGMQAEAAEAAHFWAAWMLVPYIAMATTGRDWAVLCGLVSAELAMNVYPMLHLRLTRGRIAAVLDRRRHA